MTGGGFDHVLNTNPVASLHRVCRSDDQLLAFWGGDPASNPPPVHLPWCIMQIVFALESVSPRTHVGIHNGVLVPMIFHQTSWTFDFKTRRSRGQIFPRTWWTWTSCRPGGGVKRVRSQWDSDGFWRRSPSRATLIERGLDPQLYLHPISGQARLPHFKWPFDRRAGPEGTGGGRLLRRSDRSAEQ